MNVMVDQRRRNECKGSARNSRGEEEVQEEIKGRVYEKSDGHNPLRLEKNGQSTQRCLESHPSKPPILTASQNSRVRKGSSVICSDDRSEVIPAIPGVTMSGSDGVDGPEDINRLSHSRIIVIEYPRWWKSRFHRPIQKGKEGRQAWYQK